MLHCCRQLCVTICCCWHKLQMGDKLQIHRLQKLHIAESLIAIEEI